VYDLKHYIIPDKVVYSAIAVSGIWYLVSGIFLDIYTRYEILNTIYSAFGAASFFLAIVLISRGKWMGVGDIKLAFLMGLILGWPNISVALFLAFLIGAIIGVGLMIFGKKTIKSEVPFGPFLVAGTFIALFFGREIINWYVQSFYFN
ncbi:MAG: A24 family peptidase, partial [Candidatus Buchananbacteria bacterium]|nr:A24 family peptidase [Candidatus Buchananbacteria bacterium]